MQDDHNRWRKIFPLPIRILQMNQSIYQQYAMHFHQNPNNNTNNGYEWFQKIKCQKWSPKKLMKIIIIYNKITTTTTTSNSTLLISWWVKRTKKKKRIKNLHLLDIWSSITKVNNIRIWINGYMAILYCSIIRIMSLKFECCQKKRKKREIIENYMTKVFLIFFSLQIIILFIIIRRKSKHKSINRIIKSNEREKQKNKLTYIQSMLA